MRFYNSLTKLFLGVVISNGAVQQSFSFSTSVNLNRKMNHKMMNRMVSTSVDTDVVANVTTNGGDTKISGVKTNDIMSEIEYRGSSDNEETSSSIPYPLSTLIDITPALGPIISAYNAQQIEAGHEENGLIKLYAKEEFLNPASKSHKDRIARAIIREAMGRGELTRADGGRKTSEYTFYRLFFTCCVGYWILMVGWLVERYSGGEGGGRNLC